jgi:hypothetical protein
MSFGFRTYAAVEAVLKMRNFNLFVMRTCAKRSDNPFRRDSCEKHEEVGVLPLLRSRIIKRGLAAAIVLPATLGCLAGSTPCAQVSPLSTFMNLARMVDESENIALARVARVTAEPHPQFQNLNTVVVALQVIEPLKGAPGRELVFRQYVADSFETKSPLGYRVGEEIVLLLRKPSEEGLTSPVGFEQGRFRVERDAAGRRIVRNGMNNAALFDGIDAYSPGLKPRLSPALQQLVAEHRAGPMTYDQFKSIVGGLIAARQNAR